jgi:hypothetical protein
VSQRQKLALAWTRVVNSARALWASVTEELKLLWFRMGLWSL